jgi:hypothetical protein
MRSLNDGKMVQLSDVVSVLSSNNNALYLRKRNIMKKFYVLPLCVLGLLLVSCGEPVAPTATPTQVPAKVTVASSKTWHVTQQFSSTEDFFGTSQYIPDRDVYVTVTEPWRIVWQAHLDDKDENGFSLFVCQEVSIGSGMTLPECTDLVYNGSGSGITAPITKVYNDVELDMNIGGLNSTWSLKIEELS